MHSTYLIYSYIIVQCACYNVHLSAWSEHNKFQCPTKNQQATADVPGLKPGMKLEAVDRNNPPSYCVATVVKVMGHRVCIRYDGYGNDDSNDFWCNFQAEELHPIGWCAQNGYPLQAPKGIHVVHAVLHICVLDIIFV